MTFQIVLLVIFVLGFGLIAYLLVRQKQQAGETKEDRDEEKKQILEIVGERISSSEKFVDGKKDLIKEMIGKIEKELGENRRKLEEVERERGSQFSALKTVFEEYKQITGGLKESADHLKMILSNNQQRGKYGEEVAENLLKSAGFVRGQNYTANEEQDTIATRPDFTIFLPDKTKINVDAKFPLQSLVKYHEAEKKTDQDFYLKQFATDVKQKVKQVTSRDYINVEENTVDFVILFIPNEMIFSFIYDKLYDVWNEAMKNKVIMAGPFSFTAILRMIYQSYKNFKYQENMFDIIKLVKQFEVEFDKFNAEFDKLGDKVQSLSTQYQTVSTTRTKKLVNIVEKIRNEEILPPGESIKLLDD